MRKSLGHTPLGFMCLKMPLTLTSYPSYTTSERLGIVSFQVPNLAATHSLDQVVIQNPSSSMRKTAKKVTFQDPISETAGSHTCSNTPASCCSKRKTASLKGEDALTSSHSKTINNNQEVKVGSSIHFKTLPPLQVLIPCFQDH